MAALATFVSVRDDDGTVHSFGPGSDVPDWAARKITNPAAWEDGDVPFPAGGSDGDGDGDGPPPRAGRGSGEDKWRAYAADQGVELPDDVDGRDEVIDYLEKAGVPVE